MVEIADEADAPVQSGSSTKKLILAVVATLVIFGAVLGILNFMGIFSFGQPVPASTEPVEGEEQVEAIVTDGPPLFFTLYPDMLVNFTVDGKAHFLKVSIDVMSRNEVAIKGVEEYHPVMRNNILKLFQQVDYKTVHGPTGMESMQAIALEEIKRILKSYSVNNEIEGVFFTSFVVQ